tara:strand:- start:49 stop:255 length:207 start_codon:yes stop_codon:yes gene_type:complete
MRMKKLTEAQKKELRETLDKENKRVNYEQSYGGSFNAVKRRKDLTPSRLAHSYNVSLSQILIAGKGLL